MISHRIFAATWVRPGHYLAAAFWCFSAAAVAQDVHVPLKGGATLEFEQALTGKLKSEFGEGWTRAVYTAPSGKQTRLFSDEPLTSTGGVVFEGPDSSKLSPLGRYAVVGVVRQGILESPGQKLDVEGREYCPVLETATGCVVSMQTGEICRGNWSAQEKWTYGGDDRSGEMLTRTTNSVKDLLDASNNSKSHVKLSELLADNLGALNLLACDPQTAGNRDAYNAVSMQLEKEGAHVDAKYLSAHPSLTPSASGGNSTSRRVAVDKSWLYSSPLQSSQTKMYLVKGDSASVVKDSGDGWLLVDYKKANGDVLRKWIRNSDVSSAHS
jgi:hypothetical protein